MTKKQIVISLIAVILVIGIGIVGINAYMTDTDDWSNVVTIGDVHLRAYETTFPTEDTDDDTVPDECELLIPYEEITKNPRIENTGTNDAIVFFKVTAPVETVTLISEDGVRGEEGPADLFWFKQEGDADTLHENHFNGDWIELTTIDNEFVDCPEVNNEGRGYTYIFGYNTRIESGEITSTLFDKIQNKKYGSRTIEAEEIESIKIEGYAIQADEIARNGIDIDTSKTLSETDLTYIYNIFFNQNEEELS